MFTLALVILWVNLFSQSYCSYNEKVLYYGEDFPSIDLGITTGWILDTDFSDEFNYYDPIKWPAHNNDCHPMSPVAYFSSSNYNVYVSSGKLILKAIRESSTQCDINHTYSTGWVRFHEPIRYGYIEIQCYLPAEIALNPGFWLFGDEPTAYDEIDVFEKSLDQSDSYSFLQNFYHDLFESTQGSLKQRVHFTSSFQGISAKYAVEWLPEEINYYVNGNITKSVKFASPSSGLIGENTNYSCIDFLDAVGQRIQLSLSVNYQAYSGSDLTRGFEIDYVHSYKLSQGYNYEYWPTAFSMSDANIFKVNKSVKLGGSGHTANIPENQNITVWATDSIVLGPNFNVSGSTFTARTIVTSSELFY